jgi:hypothetical protein
LLVVLERTLVVVVVVVLEQSLLEHLKAANGKTNMR